MTTLEIRREAPSASGPQTLQPAIAVGEIDVSVIVVTWNSGGWIEACLKAIPRACDGLAYETIVYDNASSDQTIVLAAQAGDHRTRLLQSENNTGFAGGLNGGIREARGRYLFLLNPDCEPAPKSITSLVAHLDRNRAAAAAAPLLIGEDGKPQRDFQLRRLPTLGSLLAEILLLNDIFPSNPLSARHHCRDLDIRETQEVEQPAAAALLIRRSAVDAIGEFDETFSPAWFEDVDYCRRLAGSRARIDLVPAATAMHHGGSSLEHLPPGEFVDVWYRNLFRYARKWMRTEQVEVLRWGIIAGMFLRAAAVMVGLRTNGQQGRLATARSYLAVAGKAFHRWDAESRSS